MFKYQSTKVIAKAQADSQEVMSSAQGSIFVQCAAEMSSRAPEPGFVAHTYPLSPATSSRASGRIARSPKPDRDNISVDFFANNFTCGGPVEERSSLFYIPPNFEELLRHDASLKLSVQCVGTMALARLQRSSQCLHEAQKQYVLALRSLNETWRGDTEMLGSQRCAMFSSILFLSFFEVLASYDSSSRQSWRTHLGGLGTLFDQYQMQFKHTAFGAHMFRQTRSQIIYHALQTQTPVPEPFTISLPGEQFMPFDDCDALLIRLANLQARGRMSGPTSSLVADLRALDHDLDSWAESLPASWSFAEHPNKHPSGLWWDARCDVYSSGFIAHTWNKVRAARIRTLDLLEDSVQHLSPGSPVVSQYRSAVEPASVVAGRLATDICATIHTYWRPSSVQSPWVEDSGPPLVGTVFWYLWVLEVVGSMRDAPPKLTLWIVRCFERIYQVTGVMKLQQVADRLRSGDKGPVFP